MAKPATPEADLDQADPDAEVLDDGDPDEAGLDLEDDTVEPSDGAEEDDEEKEDEEDEPPPAKKAGEGEEDDDEPDPDDVEADLDTILKDRIAANDDEDDDEDEEEEVPTRTTEKPKEGPNRVTPRQPGEFVCTSCFLVKQRTQLADAANDLCDDCV
jgi:hypothetical protein